jgi:MFS transporter, PPP family, 3-phenylpropionic acid transporter
MRSVSLNWAPPFYFIYYAAAAALVPFLVVYYQDLGLTGTQIGFLAGIPPLVTLFGAPVWGAISDVTQRHKLSLLIAIGSAIVLALALSAFKTFAWLIPVVMLFAFFSSPIMPLVDNATMNMLGDQKDRYGRIRLWGAVGWGVAAPVVGWLIESGSVMWSFWGYAALMMVGLLVTLNIPVSGQIGTVFRDGIWAFLSNPRWLVFLAVAFCGGIALSMTSNFLFIFLRDLGADKFLLGLTLTFATLSELPMLYFSDRLLRRWGAQRLMSAAMLFYAIRALAYSFIVVPWEALPIQLLHGPTFSLMWLSGVSYADEIAPGGLGATAQGLFSGVMLGIGSAAGAFLGGFLYDHVGLVSMFRLAAFILLLGLGFILFVEKRNHEHSL